MNVALELLGAALILFVAWLAWPPLPLALIGALCILIANRRR